MSETRHETTIGAALRRAGYHTTRERLYALAADALAQSGNSKDRALPILLAAVRKNADLLHALCEPYLHRAGMAQLAAVEGDRAAATKPAASSKGKAAPAAQSPPTTASSAAKAVPPRKATAVAARPQKDMVAAKVEAVRESILDRLKVKGQPVGDWCPRQLRTVPMQMRADARVIELLMAGVPDDMRLRDAHTPERADALARQAREEVQG